MQLYLADTSAWNRANASDPVAERWTELVLTGQLALCPPILLELLYSARGAADYFALKDELAGLPMLPLTREAAERALEVQALLGSRSQHRGPTPSDLLIAAVAETSGAALLHYDRHFDLIGRATGQRVEWLARRGSL